MPAKTRSRLLGAVLLTSLVAAGGCITIGSPFPTDAVGDIQVGETTRADIRSWFGEPWRIGMENGKNTWSYGHYRYSITGRTRVRDLLLRFDENGLVGSYSFQSTYAEDLEPHQ